MQRSLHIRNVESRSPSRRTIAALLVMCHLSAVAVRGQVIRDTTIESRVSVYDDTEQSFQALGRHYTQDNDIPPNGINGPFWAVSPSAPPPGHNPNWAFEIKHIVNNWDLDGDGTDDGANDAKVAIKGTHRHGPHDGIDIDPNTLPLVVGTTSRFIPFGETRKLATWGYDTHSIPSVWDPAREEWQERWHMDGYGVYEIVEALRDPRMLNGLPMVVEGRHGYVRFYVQPEPGWLELRGSTVDGYVVYYDHASQLLRIQAGERVRLFLRDQRSGREYRDDPAQEGRLVAPQLRYLGVDERGE